MTSILRIVNYKPCKQLNFIVIMKVIHISDLVGMLDVMYINDQIEFYFNVHICRSANESHILINYHTNNIGTKLQFQFLFLLVNTTRSNHCIFSHLNKITSSYKTINVDLIFKFVLYYAYPFSRSTFLTLVQL